MKSRSRFSPAPLLTLYLSLLAGCASTFQGPQTSTSTTPPATTSAPVSVAISGATQVRLGSTAQLTATVTNTENTAVNWQVNGVNGGSTATGTISTKGLYTPPGSLPNPNTVTISAVSQDSSDASSSVSEAILNPTPSISSASITGSASPYTITVAGKGFVTGSQIQVQGKAQTTTVVSSTQLTASAALALSSSAATLPIAVANPDPGAATSSAFNAQVKISAPPISVVVTGDGQVRLGATLQLAAAVANSTNTAVNWQVNGVAGGSASAGTISAAGLYSAPAAIPNPNTVTITAVSQASSTASGTLSVAVLNPLPIITSANAEGTNSSYALSISGTGFVPTSQVQVQGATVTTTYVTPTLLSAAATITLSAGTASLPVTVLNPDPGGTTSPVFDAPVQTTLTTVTSAARLLDQATFGPTVADIQHVENIGLTAYLSEQFQRTPTALAPFPATPPTICATNLAPCVESEWWQATLNAPDQLRQRVAFALAEMFVISMNAGNDRAVVTFQNTLLNDAFGNFATLLNDVTLSPGMGSYLNMLNSNRPPAGQIANENYAREAMQLFTIGLNLLNEDGTPQLDSGGNPIPAYTQDQVQAFARAYTGWTFATLSGKVPSKFPNTTVNDTVPMVAVESAHDETAKTLLNGTILPAGQTAEEDLAGALQNIFNHPNVGPFVCRQLIQHLVTSDPSPAYVGRVAAVFANNGSNIRGDMQAVITAILMDPEARAGDTDPTMDGGHLREPVLWLTDLARGLAFTNNDAVAGNDVVANASYRTLADYTLQLGQAPYESPSVFNFFPPDYVIPGTTANAPEFAIENTATLILRLSLANTIVYNRISGFSVDLSATGPLGVLAASPANLVDTLGMIFMHGQMSSQMRTEIVNQITPMTDMAERVRVAVYLVITSPQYKIEH